MSPRPEYTSRRSGNGNLIKTWLERKKERKAQLEAEAARLIINQTASNIANIRKTLDLIDFKNSKLPDAVLNAKTDPSQTYCDLEEAVRYLSTELGNHPEIIRVDLRKIDTLLAQLALLLKQSVEEGNENAAYTAKFALAKGIEKIRFRVPENQPELLTDFIDTNAKYLEQLVTFVMISETIDTEKQACESRRAVVQADQSASEKELSDFRERLTKDRAYAVALQQMLDSDSPEGRLMWTPLQREIHSDMIRSKMKSVVAELNVLLLEQQENRLTVKEQQRDILYAKLMNTPTIEDPNLINKFKLAINELFDEIAKVDQQLDEAITFMDDISGRIKQFSYTPGRMKANEIVIKQGNQMLRNLKGQQEELIHPVDSRNVDLPLADGILTQEQIDSIKKQNVRNQQVQQQRLFES